MINDIQQVMVSLNNVTTIIGEKKKIISEKLFIDNQLCKMYF